MGAALTIPTATSTTPPSPATPPPAAPCSPTAGTAAVLSAGSGTGTPAGLLALLEAPFAAAGDAAPEGASLAGVRGALLRLLAQRCAFQVAGDQVGVRAVESLPEGLHGLAEGL